MKAVTGFIYNDGCSSDSLLHIITQTPMISIEQVGSELICIPETGIYASNVQKLRDKIIRIIEDDIGWDCLVINFSQVDAMDSIGINLIVGLFKQLKEDNKKLKITACNDALLNVFRLFKLDKEFVIEGKA